MNEKSPKSAKLGAQAESRRIEALRNTGLLDSPSEIAFDRIAHLVSKFLHVPVALVSLVDDHRQFFKSAAGLPEPWNSQRETPLTHSFCQHVTATGEPLIVTDAPHDPLVKDNLAIPDLGVIGYLGMPITLSTGETIGSLCAIDGKPRKWTQTETETLRELSRMVTSEIDLRKAIQSQQDMMAIVSHDLKNPISAMGLSAEMMERKLLKATTVEEARVALAPTLQRMKDTAKRMEQLVHEVLDHARVDSGPLPITLGWCSVQQLVEAAAEAIRARAFEKNVKIKLQSEIGDIQIPCDWSRISQVIGNIVNNAVEYTPAEKTVTIAISATEETVRITVDDQGPGIAEEIRQKIFEKFWRAPGSGSRGHGLGLYIASKLVASHGGTILAGANPDGGARFTIELPVKSEQLA